MPTLEELQNKYGKKAQEETEAETPKEISPAKDIEIKKIVPKTVRKDTKKLKGNLKSIKKALDDTNITQDDYWFLISYFTREKVSTFRESKKALEPIFRDFINNQNGEK